MKTQGGFSQCCTTPEHDAATSQQFRYLIQANMYRPWWYNNWKSALVIQLLEIIRELTSCSTGGVHSLSTVLNHITGSFGPCEKPKTSSRASILAV